MKKHLLLLLGALIALPAMARDFTYTYEGQTITYTVLDEAAKTCTTKVGGNDFTPGNVVSGILSLPEHPKDGAIAYTLTEIGDDAFFNCNSLIIVTIPKSVTTIGDYAFYDCSGLTSITIPNSVTTIGWGAFSGCGGLTSVIIPNSVTKIGWWAFEGCSGLTSVTIPNSVTTIGVGAFDTCASLQQIMVENNNPNYSSEDGVLFNKDKTTLLRCPGAKDTCVIPNSVTEIGSSAFENCSGLTSVTIPNSVISIGWSAFYGCTGLTSVTIPNSVTTIEPEAFSGCSGLTKIYAMSTVPPSVGYEAFYEVSRDIEVYVPKGAIKAYSEAEVWSEFTNYREIDDIDKIDDVEANSCYVADEYYTLQGRRVSADRLTTGIYIIGGRKVFIKQ